MIDYSNISAHSLLDQVNLSPELKEVALRVMDSERLSTQDALLLYSEAELGLLGVLASHVNHRINGNHVLFNRNYHIEPTNICIHNCTFCSYRRGVGEEEAWLLSIDDIVNEVRTRLDEEATEVHITGGVHPQWDIDYYCLMLKEIKRVNPNIHIKAYSAVELDFAFTKSGLSVAEGIERLRKCGLDSIPGGGAEIADAAIRNQICRTKTSWSRWLEIHEQAHRAGLTSNATMLYGHMETYEHRIEHMNDLRDLQDKTGGFNCFIPLKFKAQQNDMSSLGEVSTVEDMRNFAVARLFLDNIPHLKAYWPMLGKSSAKLALSFGADDLDGTIDDSTKIYSMAGAEDQSPSMSVDEVCGIIRSLGKVPVERDSLYNFIKVY